MSQNPAARCFSWIHIFTVTDTQKHKGGYTIYKITSVVFPRGIPEALTCLTVWKRFHDVKRLYRELSRRNKTLHLGDIPEPTDASFFKRFDADVIQRRKQYILELLDFAAQHPALYKCHAFAQFFSGAECFGGGTPPVSSPLHGFQLIGAGSVDDGGKEGECAVAEICKADECKGVENQCLLKHECDKRLLHRVHDSSTTDGIRTVSSNDEASEQREEDSATKTTVAYDTKPCKDYARFLTPMASIESDDSDYIYEAALEFSHAVQAEANLEYQDAYTRYKHGVEILLNGAKDDGNDDRKFIAKAKISKYLSRADDIYDKFLRHDHSKNSNGLKNNFQLSIDVSDCADNTTALYLERPWNHLAKYKVLRVLGERVMQVQCITEPQRPTYVMKGIEKPSSNSLSQSVFLPQHVPYMVDLLAFFQCDQKIFILLKQAEGGRLYDYLLSYTPNIERAPDLSELFPEVKQTTNSTGVDDVEVGTEVVSDTPVLLTPPNAATDFNELVRCSQQLLESVSNTLKRVDEVKEEKEEEPPYVPVAIPKSMTVRRVPEVCLKQWARELAVAIHSLHGKGVILSDLNMDNLLLGSKGQLLLTYFYQNECLDAANDGYVHRSLSWNALEAHFVAPERPLTSKSDWWSYGVILYQLLVGLPFKSAHPGRIDFYFCVQYPEHVDISTEARNLLENLLVAPDERFSMEQLQQHEFFANTNWEEVYCNGLNTSTTKNTVGTMPSQQHA